jgi:phosphoglucosamine mutase
MRGDDEAKPVPAKRNIFGTDGVRGLANAGPITPEGILRLGIAAGRYFRNGDGEHRVVIGKDTRLSGYLIEPALTAGFAATGMKVFLLGPLPTPAMSMLTRSLRADLGVMISASHNPYHDNGVKFFDRDGYKLSDEAEAEIERLMAEDYSEALVTHEGLGRVQRIDDAGARYIEFAKNTFPRRKSLEGIRIALDCANGAAYKVAPAVLWELGAEVRSTGVSPNGLNINLECGSTYPKALQKAVADVRADIGIALDGDADRVIICDEKGRIIDGDQILALIGSRMAARQTLKGGGVVSTVMANMGLERYFATKSIALHRAKVGDRYVVEMMRQKGSNLGGEPSGHIILSDHSATGDGLVTALNVLAAVVGEGRPVSEACDVFKPFPQLTKNVRVTHGEPLADANVKKAIASAETTLGAAGRLIVRASGTEPLIRVTAEAEDEKLVKRVVADVAGAIETAR